MKFKLLLPFVLFYLLISKPFQAQPVSISGHFPGAAGETAFLHGYSDFMSKNEVVVASTVIDKEGHFAFTLNIDHTSPFFLEIGFYRVSFYAVPGTSWVFSSRDFQVRENGNPLLPQSYLPCEIKGPRTDSLLRRMNAQISVLLDTAAYEIYLKQNTGPIDSLVYKTLKAYSSDREFIEAASYYLPTLYPGARLPLGISSLGEIKTPTHSFYFFEWLDDYLSKSLTRENPLSAGSGLTRNLIQAVNKDEDLPSVKYFLSQHFGVEDPLMTDLLTLASLKVFYRTPVYQNKSVLNLLRQMQASTLHNDIAFMAGNLIQRFTAGNQGTPLPDFKAISITGDTLSPSAARGKPLYIVFARQSCISCLNSLEMLRPLYDRYKDKFQIICFFTSHDTLSEANFIRSMNYPWPVVVAGRDYELLRTFRAYSLPLEILTNANGEINAWPAYRPGEGLEAILEKMLSKPSTPRLAPPQRK
jgi:hypothetical protein